VGFDVIPQAAEEIDLPFKEIGKMLIFSVLMAVAWYALIVLGVSLALDKEQMAASELVTADATAAVLGGSWAGKLLVLAGIGGIITSWNAFLIGGSRAVYALAHAHMLPRFLAKLHPKYNTPYNAILLVGVLSVLAPLFGRKTLVWLVDAGGLGIIVAYGMVALSFILLRRNEPEMDRPFKVAQGTFVGYAAFVLSIGIAILYLPGSPAALVWPYEWAIFLVWSAFGAVLYIWALLVYGRADASKIIREELLTGHSDLAEGAEPVNPKFP
jgi:amino acid transporter